MFCNILSFSPVDPKTLQLVILLQQPLHMQALAHDRAKLDGDRAALQKSKEVHKRETELFRSQRAQLTEIRENRVL